MSLSAAGKRLISSAEEAVAIVRGEKGAARWHTFGKPKDLALGRLKIGQMNRTESAYAAHLELRRAAGEVLWWKFEAIKLRLADNTFLSPDFFVMLAGGQLEAHETKGFMRDDANVKIKVAAETFPFRFVLVRAKAKKDGGGWSYEVYE